MAKKKTENIKAAPVLRSQGGEQPTPTPEQTGTRTYQIMDPWKDRGVVNLVDVKAVDGEITEVKINGEPAGGGGGFAPVAVNVVNNSQSDVQIDMSVVYDGRVEPEWFFDANTDDDYQVIAPSIGFINTVTQQIQIGSVTGTGNVTVSTFPNGTYIVNIYGAGGIVIS